MAPLLLLSIGHSLAQYRSFPAIASISQPAQRSLFLAEKLHLTTDKPGADPGGGLLPFFIAEYGDFDEGVAVFQTEFEVDG